MQTLNELISHSILAHHAYTRESLVQISAMINSPEMQGRIISESLRESIAALEQDLLPHLIKEEQILFPYIIKLERNPRQTYDPHFGTIDNPIRVLGNEHNSVIKLLEKLRELTSSYQTDSEDQTVLSQLYTALGELDRDLVTHIQMENEVLFPKARELEILAITSGKA